MQRSVRRLTVAGLIIVATAAGGWAVWWPSQGDAVERVVGIASTALTAWLVFEVHEERLTRDRPFVFVDFVVVRFIEGSGVRESHLVADLGLRIRNEGRSPAGAVHIKPTAPILDQSGLDVLQNPVLRDGLSFLAPGESMTLELHEDTTLDQFVEEALGDRAGDASPPERSLRVKWHVEYRDGITGRHYGEAFTVDLDASHYGWTTPTITT